MDNCTREVATGLFLFGPDAFDLPNVGRLEPDLISGSSAMVDADMGRATFHPLPSLLCLRSSTCSLETQRHELLRGLRR